jgi:DNA-directed RNA polymerase subunit RPC12/RpoP
MKILYERYFGLIARCNSCGCILGYEPKDVSNSQNIRCPRCSFSLWVPLNPNYDGIIKEEKEKDGEVMVSEQQRTGEDNSGST